MARASGTVRQLRAACSPLGLAALAVVAAVQWCVGGAGVLPVAWAWSDSVDTAAEAEREAAFLALKAEKEAFVSGHNGAPMWEVSLVVSSFPAGLLLHRVLYAFLEERGGRTAPSTVSRRAMDGDDAGTAAGPRVLAWSCWCVVRVASLLPASHCARFVAARLRCLTMARRCHRVTTSSH